MDSRVIGSTRRILLSLLVLIPGITLSQPVDWEFNWSESTPLPVGLGGLSAGVHNEALLVAGGSYFPVSMFEGGVKEWVDSVFVLESEQGEWQVYPLGAPRAYGAAASTPSGLVIAGGTNASGLLRSVIRVAWLDSRVHVNPLPPLPESRALSGSAVVDNTLYVVGGQTASNPGGENALLSLDLDDPSEGWMVREPLPGPGRLLPIVAAQGNTVIVAGGARMEVDSGGTEKRVLLLDAYSFDPRSGWRQLSNPPRSVFAAPSVSIGASHVLIFGGIDVDHIERLWELRNDYPPFCDEVLAYHTITDTWTTVGRLPASTITTQAVFWDGRIVIPGGEDRPGSRSAVVNTARIETVSTRLSTLDTIVVVIYFVLLVGMGLYFARRERTTKDYFLAGNRIPWWAAGLSIFGTQLSAITFLAAPARTYATDWIYFIVMVTIVMVAPVVVYLFIPTIRQTEITSAYEYLERRFNLAVRLFGSAAFVLFQIGRVGIVIFLPALALAAVTSIHILICILAIGILSTIYTTLGGIEAVVWTDVAQVIVLMGGALLALIIILTGVEGGWSGFIDTAAADGKFNVFNWTWDMTVEAFWLVLVGNLFANLVPYTTDQSVIQRYLTTASERESKRAVWTNAFMTIPAALLFFGLGTALYVFYKESPELLDPTLHTDAILPLFVVQQLPAGIRGLTIAGIFAAAMSSLDSSLNSVATAIVTDWVRRFKAHISDASALAVARWITIVFGVLGTLMAILLSSAGISSLLDLFREILGLFGGSLLGLFGLGMLTRRANGPGALIGAFASAGILFTVQQATDVHFFLYAAVGAVSCFIVGYTFSLVFGHEGNAPDPDH